MILACRTLLGSEAFEDWGWRIPFVLSILLLAISVYIRMQLNESPVFMKMKAEGKASKAPLTESFARWDNLKVVIMSLLGGTAGQAVVWYTGQFYALFFLLQMLKIDPQTANLLIAGSLLIGTPFFILFGSLSDRIGRKKIIMAGCIIAALTYFPIFKALTEYGNPDVFVAQEQNPVVVVADPDQCAFQFDPVGKAKFTSSCDIAKSLLAKRAIPYQNERAEPGSVAQIRIGERVIPSFDGRALPRRTSRPRASVSPPPSAVRSKKRAILKSRSRQDPLPDGAVAADLAGDLRDHGLRADRRMAGGAVPGAHPLHLHVAAVPHR